MRRKTLRVRRQHGLGDAESYGEADAIARLALQWASASRRIAGVWRIAVWVTAERKAFKTSMTTGKLITRLRLLAASGCAVLWFSAGCVDLTPPWNVTGQGGAGGNLDGSGGATGTGGPMLDDGSASELGLGAGSGGTLGQADHGAGGRITRSDGSDDLPLPGSGGVLDTGVGGGSGGLVLDGPVLGTGGAQRTGGAGGKSDAGSATGGVRGTGGASVGGRGGFDAASTGARDTVSDRGADPGPEVVPDLGADLRLDVPNPGPDAPDALGLDLSPDSNSLLEGLVAYYKCDETSGTTLSDSSGHGYHGTLNGGFSLDSPGKVGRGLALTKSGSGYASLPTQIFAGLKNVTVATWVRVRTLDGWARVFDTGINKNVPLAPPEGTQYMALMPKSASSGNLYFAISVNGFSHEESLNGAVTPTDKWQHVAIVLDGAAGAGWLYIDGNPVVTNEPTGIQPDDLGAIDYAFLGKSQFTQDPYFDGIIDEFRVYSRALSAAEVQALYAFTGL